MKQLTEDYVSYEIAVLLKEKGFDGKCRMIYREHDKQMIYHTPNPDDLLDFETNKRKLEKHSKKQHCQYLLCPTHQMALKWLREVHKLFVNLDLGIANGDKGVLWSIVRYNNNDIEFLSDYTFEDSYEQAVEAALKYTLENLI